MTVRASVIGLETAGKQVGPLPDGVPPGAAPSVAWRQTDVEAALVEVTVERVADAPHLSVLTLGAENLQERVVYE
jgi:hypothetical protein